MRCGKLTRAVATSWIGNVVLLHPGRPSSSQPPGPLWIGLAACGFDSHARRIAFFGCEVAALASRGNEHRGIAFPEWRSHS